MTAEHNHSPRCCCPRRPEHTTTGYAPEICPACIEHGELAPAIECPQCHQPIGRPHTDFCTLAPDRVWPDGMSTSSPIVAPPEARDSNSIRGRALADLDRHLLDCGAKRAPWSECLLPPGHEGDHNWTTQPGSQS